MPLSEMRRLRYVTYLFTVTHWEVEETDHRDWLFDLVYRVFLQELGFSLYLKVRFNVRSC